MATATSHVQKALSVFFSLVLCISFLPTAAFAAVAPSSMNTLDTTYSGGEGTSELPYLISTAQDLADVATNVNAGTGVDACYKLTADIDLSSVCSEASGTSWTPIGTNTNRFAGTFDGDGHTISGLYINSTSSVNALFGYTENDGSSTNATIENLVVSGSVASTTTNSAGIVSYAYGVTLSNVGNEVNVSGTTSSGGLISMIYNTGVTTIDGCYNKGSVSGSYYAGGIAGWMYGAATISNTYNAGTVSATGNTSSLPGAGGVVGYIGASGSTLTNVFNVGAVSCSGVSPAAPIVALAASSSGTSYTVTCSNVYYLDNSSTGTDDTPISSTSMTATEIASQSFASTLGSSFMYRSSDAYPILAWEFTEGMPTITTQPAASATYTVGDTAAALVVAAQRPAAGEVGADGTLSYQWYSNTTGVADSTADTAIEGATAASYTPATTTAGVTYYYCVVTNTYAGGTQPSATAVSSACRVLVQSATQAATPTITTQPDNATVEQGEQVTLSIVVSTDGEGIGTLSYQWYSNTTNSTEGATAIEGATEASLTVTANEVGTTYYYCVVTNTFEETKTATAICSIATVTVTGITVSTQAELEAIATAVNDGTNTYVGKTITLANDIELAGDWTPIGVYSSSSSSRKPFRGTFDGDGHTITISGIDSSAAGRGLFGYVEGATIKNLKTAGSFTVSGSPSGGIAAAAGQGSTFVNCGSSVDITNTAATSAYMGGIVGHAGNGTSSSPVVVESCYNKGNLTAGGGYLGGITGQCGTASYLKISNCYNLGTITTNSTSSYVYVAGICSHNASLSNCYNAGDVCTPNTSSTTYVSSICAGSTPSYTSSCYWLEGTAPRGSYASSSYAVSMTAEELASASTVAMLNSGSGSTDEVWADGTLADQTYPALAWEGTPGAPTIITQPQDGYAVFNETAGALSVTAALPEEGKIGSDGMLSYQWYSNTTGVADSTADTAIEGATAASYTPATTTAGVTYYYCVITNTFDGTAVSVNSSVAEFTTLSATPATPTITADPSNITLMQSKTATLSVVASFSGSTGAGTLAYQWYVSDENANSGGTAIEGATSDTYAPSSDELGTKYYYCEVSNCFEGVYASAVASQAAAVTVEPLQISSAQDLADFATTVNAGTSFSGMTVVLTDDIDLSSVCSEASGSSWTPIGTYTTSALDRIPFSGTFDGQGHTVSGLYINSSTAGQGLFGYIDGATIKNLVVQGSVTSSASYEAGVAAYANGACTFENVGNEASVTSTSTATSGYQYVGGVAGYVDASTSSHAKFESCYNKAAITGRTGYIGGIAAYSSYVDFAGCYNAGAITQAYSGSDVAGITSYSSSGTAYGDIKDCYNSGVITFVGTSSYYGAICGEGGTATNCYYLEGTSDQGAGGTSSSSRVTESKTAEEMAALSFVSTLNADTTYFRYGKLISQSTPILAWEAADGIPVITGQSDMGWGIVGTTAGEISVTATTPEAPEAGYDGTLSYQWYKSATESFAEAQAVEGATGASLDPDTSAAGTSYYFCVVTNTFDDTVLSFTSDPIKVAVFETDPATPEITTNPTAIETMQGATPDALTVEATISDGGTPAYQWYVSDEDSNTGGTAIAGATEASYVPSSAALGTLYYYCVVTNVLEGIPTATAASQTASVFVDSYKVSTAAELLKLAEAVNAGDTFEGRAVELIADIDLSVDDSTSVWTPIGANSSKSFQGSFYGNGHTISGLNVTSSTYAGLFGYVAGTGTIKDLIVKGEMTTSSTYAGGVAAYVDGDITFENVGAEVDITSTVASASSNSKGVGGVIGGTSSSAQVTVASCYNKGAISAPNFSTSSYSSYAVLGGIAGRLTKGTITDCYNTGDITTTGFCIGGLIGYASSDVVPQRCYNTGLVSSESTYSYYATYQGALLGYASYNYTGDLSTCYYLEGTNTQAAGHSTSYAANTTALVAATVDDISLEVLGNKFVAASGSTFNDGAPRLAWETDLAEGLAKMIEAAKTDLAQTAVSTDGTDVDTGAYWVDSDAVAVLSDAISAAAEVLASSSAATQEQLDTATGILYRAINTFDAAKQAGTKTADKTALSDAIAKATEARSTAAVSADGTDVYAYEKWVTQADADALVVAIAAATAVYADENATADETAAAVTALQAAVESFEAAQKAGTRAVDKTALSETITAAGIAAEAVATSEDGTDVYANENWATQQAKEALAAAVAEAQAAYADENATADEIAAAAAALQSAIETFGDSVQAGTKTADKTALSDAIAEATEARSKAAVSEDGTDVYAYEKWVTQADADALVVAIAAATAVASTDAATQTQVDAATTALQTAQAAFEAAKQAGTRIESGAVYRLYNSTTGEHLYTTDANEYATLPSYGWEQEGVSWYAPKEGGTAVYRLYNAISGDHHYTTDTNEVEVLSAGDWTNEGIAFYSADAETGTPVYRLYNSGLAVGQHLFTTDANEYASLPAAGWEQEDIAWYGLAS